MARNQPAARQPFGEIYDLGYRHYDGPRLGRSHAIRALIIYSIKRGLGIKKKWTSKIIPFLVYIAAFAVSVISAGILAFVPTEEFDISYHQLNDYIMTMLLIYAAALGPEMLSDDRRENVLGLYFARALTRFDYLVAKVTAMAALMGTVAFGPALVLFLTKVMLADSPISYFFNNIDDAGRVLIFGVLISAYLAAISLAIAAYTDRKGISSAVFIGGLFILAGIANALHNALDGELRRYIILFDPLDLMPALSAWVFGESVDMSMADLPGIFYLLGVLAVVAAAAGVMYRRYLAME